MRRVCGQFKSDSVTIGILAMVLLSVGAVSLNVLGAVLYVDASATGANNGSSWADAYTDLQTALTAAAAGAYEIRVAEGMYKPTTGTDRNATFQLQSGVSLYGGYPSGGGVRDWESNETILSGDIGTLDYVYDNCYHVVTGYGTDATAILDGFTVRDGRADGPLGLSNGAGMFNQQGSPTVTNCTFTGNSAEAGGGMYNCFYDLTVTNCTFSDNTASYGGGMYSEWSSPTVTDCTFSGNIARDDGGAMFNADNSPTVTHCTFSGNAASDLGGGMCNSGSNSTVIHCAFSGNSGRTGGGMYNGFSDLTVTNCSFFGNSAADDGGGMCNGDNSSTLTHCTFSGNTAGRRGGGMWNAFSNPTVTNCTLTGNTAGTRGGGMHNLRSGPTVTNCTLFGNSAADGGGMYNDNSNTAVKNSILAANTPDNCNGSVTSDGYNLERGSSCGCTETTDRQNTDPLLGALTDNGGPTRTHALLPGSPALDAIPAPYNGAPATDQRGYPRPYPAGGLADIGAVEMQQAHGEGDVDGDGMIDLLDVVLCQQIASGLVHGAADQRAAADVDDDGDVDAEDVRILSEYVLGTRATLP